MLYLADTNIFLRLAEPKHPMRAETKRAINTLVAKGDVAAMNVHGVTHLLTYNKGHFVRFSGIVVISPSEIASSQSTPAVAKSEEKD